jgi:hypothetical protein
MTTKQDKPALMEGRTEFYPFVYLLSAADRALNAAKVISLGRNYHYVSCVVFSAFAVEAVVNHIGSDHIPEWVKTERKISGLKERLEAIAAKFNLVLDFNTAPAKTVTEAYDVRTKLAHGKTWVSEQCYFDDGKGSEAPDPDWLQKCFDEAWATKCLVDARVVITQLLAKAGYPSTDLHNMGCGSYKEVKDPQATTRQPVWKIKGT